MGRAAFYARGRRPAATKSLIGDGKNENDGTDPGARLR
jgi:hypothetical protein